jgi:hypothetical protein
MHALMQHVWVSDAKQQTVAEVHKCSLSCCDQSVIGWNQSINVTPVMVAEHPHCMTQALPVPVRHPQAPMIPAGSQVDKSYTPARG